MAADPREFEAIESPIFKSIRWRDREVRIVPLKVGQIPGFAKAVGPVLKAIPGTGGGWEDMDVVGMVAEHGEALIAACAIATGIPEQEIREADLDDFMVVIAEVISVNADFFRRRMPQAAPKLAGIMSSLGDGSIPSKS